MKIITTAILSMALMLPMLSSAATVEISNIKITNSEGGVIHSGDASGKMVPIYGGEEGREVLGKLIRRSTNEDLSARDQLIAEVLEMILINRWRELADQ